LGWGIPSVQEAFNGNIDLWTLEVYRVVPFACWVPNILIAEAIIGRERKKREKA
jgi:hypothetical protein